MGIVAPTVLTTTDAQADARSDARTHYLAGVKAYNAGDYKTAIREFSSAQSLAPADLNNYNLALCYDKLGDAEPAVQYYKAYLDKVPGTDKRAEIEASMQRLDSALKSSAAKKAEEARKADEAKRQIDAKKAADEDAARKKAEEEAARKLAEDEAKKPPVGPEVGPALPGNPGVGSTGTPSTGQVRPTGDSQLDRVNSINIDEVRDRRVGGASSGIADRKRPPSRVDPRGGVDPALDTTEPAREGPRTAAADPRAKPAAEPAAPTDKPKQTPVYKKWWFWAVVAVSAYVVYSIASEDSSSNTRGRELPPMPNTAPAASGMTLMRW
ncbi:MAG: hypothetical protein M3619_21235 [Myxococcota bacterium]|nr:hypothetical protein [Myxococcota bacterium]